MNRLLTGLLLFGLLLAPRAAYAHGYLLRAMPEDRAVLDRAPARVQYWFSEPLEPEFSSLAIVDSSGAVLATGGLSPNDDKLLTARLPTDLPDGAYAVDIRLAFASDGHVIAERRLFFVGAAVEGLSGVTASDSAVPLEVVWRTLLLGGATLLAGALSLYAWVLVPAWGSREHAAGLLPPRVMRRLFGIAAAALGVILVANVLALVQQSMAFFGADAGRVLSEGLWNIVRTGTRFGDTWNARMLLLAIIAALLVVARWAERERPAWVRPSWTAAAWAMPPLFFTFSIAAHAAGSLVLPWLAIASDWLHGTMVGLWVGGLAALALVLPAALAPLEEAPRRAALRVVLGRFSRLAFAAALLVVATGLYSASNWFTEADDLPTTYGAALALKLVMVGGLLALAALHHAAVHPERYRRFDALRSRLGALARTLRLEAVFGVAAVVLAGWVASTPVPQPMLAQQIPAPSGSVDVGGLSVRAAITPGGPGANTYDIQLARGGAPLEAADVRVQLVNPTLERRGPRHAAEAAGAGLYVAAGAEIARSGEWWALVDVVEGGRLERTAFALPVRDEAAVQLTRAPSFLNIAALALVVGALGVALAPALRRAAVRLDLGPAAVLIAVFGLALGIAATVGAVLLSDASTAQTEAALYPLPQRVNTVLPDAASLARGQETYTDACGWAASPDLVRELTERLGRLRDEELYAFTRDGWRGLPPCDAALPDAARWDIVNYLRTFDLGTTIVIVDG